MLGRVLTQATIETYADDIIVLFKMWNIGQADAYQIAKQLKYLCQKANPADWKNPLEGSGMIASPNGIIPDRVEGMPGVSLQQVQKKLDS